DALGGYTVLVPPAMRPLYHAAAVLASNGLVAVLSAAVRVFDEVGIPEGEAVQALLPLVRGTLDNLENLGVRGALTGPVGRGDVDTVRLHLARLSGQDRALYCALGMELLRLSRAAGLDPQRAAGLEAPLSGGRGASRSTSITSLRCGRLVARTSPTPCVRQCSPSSAGRTGSPCTCARTGATYRTVTCASSCRRCAPVLTWSSPLPRTSCRSRPSSGPWPPRSCRSGARRSRRRADSRCAMSTPDVAWSALSRSCTTPASGSHSSSIPSSTTSTCP